MTAAQKDYLGAIDNLVEHVKSTGAAQGMRIGRSTEWAAF
jgi:hypothetical protein